MSEPARGMLATQVRTRDTPTPDTSAEQILSRQIT
jgi:hypothetical protein